MTETTHTQTTPDGAFRPDEGRSPEYRLAVNALRGLRQDLFHDAFAYRPLPRRGVDGPLAGRLPGRTREYAAWAPHLLVAGAGVLAMFAAWNSAYDGLWAPITALLALAPVLLTLVRPVGAFWLSLAASAVTSMAAGTFGD